MELFITGMVTVNEILDTLDTEGLGVVDGNEISDVVDTGGLGVAKTITVLTTGRVADDEELVTPDATRSSLSLSWTYVDTLPNFSDGAVIIVWTIISVPTTVTTNLTLEEETFRDKATAARYDSVNERIEAL